MTPNELLLWLSARKEGSWRQFKAAVETLDLANSAHGTEQNASLPLHLRVHFNLERLGHLEFDAAECEKGWRVVPPALAVSQHDGHVTGVLCGARTPKLLERIEQAAPFGGKALTARPSCFSSLFLIRLLVADEVECFAERFVFRGAGNNRLAISTTKVRRPFRSKFLSGVLVFAFIARLSLVIAFFRVVTSCEPDI
jgi:hypothetical protein